MQAQRSTQGAHQVQGAEHLHCAAGRRHSLRIPEAPALPPLSTGQRDQVRLCGLCYHGDVGSAATSVDGGIRQYDQTSTEQMRYRDFPFPRYAKLNVPLPFVTMAPPAGPVPHVDGGIRQYDQTSSSANAAIKTSLSHAIRGYNRCFLYEM